MKITTLHNEDRQLELSEHDRQMLNQIVIYLRENFDDLEFSIRHFTLDEANSATDVVENMQDQSVAILDKKKIELLHEVTSETALIDPKILDNRDDWYNFLDKWNDLLFDNLEIGQRHNTVLS